MYLLPTNPQLFWGGGAFFFQQLALASSRRLSEMKASQGGSKAVRFGVRFQTMFLGSIFWGASCRYGSSCVPHITTPLKGHRFPFHCPLCSSTFDSPSDGDLTRPSKIQSAASVGCVPMVKGLWHLQDFWRDVYHTKWSSCTRTHRKDVPRSGSYRA